MEVSQFYIESELEADIYLTDLLKVDQYRSMDEIEFRAAKFVPDQRLKAYFLEKGRAMLGGLSSK